jgi:hypothetical protein
MTATSHFALILLLFSLAYWMPWPYPAMYSATSPFAVACEGPSLRAGCSKPIGFVSYPGMLLRAAIASILCLLAIVTRIPSLSFYEELVAMGLEVTRSMKFRDARAFSKTFVRHSENLNGITSNASGLFAKFARLYRMINCNLKIFS